MLILLVLMLLADAALVLYQDGVFDRVSDSFHSAAEVVSAPPPQASPAVSDSPSAVPSANSTAPSPAQGKPSSEKPVLETQAPRMDVLTLNSRWTGLLRISGHKGKGDLKNGSYPVRGVIECDETGTFLELYRPEDPDGSTPLLVLPAVIDYDTLIPRIGTSYSRFFNVVLEEGDAESLTMKMTDGTLSASYFYNDGTESCQIDFSIKQENST